MAILKKYRGHCAFIKHFPLLLVPLENTILGGLNLPLDCYKRSVLNKDDLLASTERSKMLHNHPLEKELREYPEQIKALILDD